MAFSNFSPQNKPSAGTGGSGSSLSPVGNVAFFIILLLVQALVFNHIHLFDCATPLLYVYFVIPMHKSSQRWATLLWCFSMGICIDIFSNTPGMAAASMTLLGLLQPGVLSLFVQHDSPDDLRPSPGTLGTAKYVSYVSILVLVHCLAFFSLEAFNFQNWLQWLACVGGSTLLTVLLVLVIENVRK